MLKLKIIHKMKKFFFKYLYMVYIVFHYNKIWGYAAISPKSFDKHQLAFPNRTQLKVDLHPLLPIIFDNIDIKPNEVILENDGISLIIQMKYDVDKVPLLFFNDKSYGYRFEYMYYQWLAKVPKVYAFNNVTFPGELHVVFYDKAYTNFKEALDFESSLVILAYGIKLLPVYSKHFVQLKKQLKNVRTPDTETVMDNFPLSHWIYVSTADYCQHSGTLSLLNSQAEVNWFDIHEPIEMPPELIQEFEVLKNAEGKPLMYQPQPVIMKKSTKFATCNRQPYYEEIQKNSAQRFNKILFLTNLSQIGMAVAMGLC